MDARAILIAENWNDSWQDIHYLIARMEKDLAEYKAKPDVNQKAVEIRAETIRRIKRFIDLTGDLVTEQAEMLKKERGLGYKHKKLLEDYAILKAYAQSKGLDTSLLPYMKIRDFNIHL
jgi:hypothetical protein